MNGAAASIPPRVVVLGGGSAGWITACLLAKEWGADRVTVVESPEIGIIGVGEGSTPQLKALFEHLGIAEADWMAACDATFKLGIRFTGWCERGGYESYFHPFPSPVDLHTEPGFVHACALARRGFEAPAHPDAWFLAAKLADEGKGPQPAPNFPFAPTYGYHFDAYKLGAFLREWATARGVTHLPLKVESVETGANGNVAALGCSDGTRVEGDVFVDCSGFRSIIAQQALGEPFVSFAENLFNDRAVVMPTPRGDSYTPQTESIAMKAGWRWSIPLTTRVGNGYVYSSRHISDADAEAELRAALGAKAEGVEARVLKMKVGRVEKSWTRNCLVAGLAQGFIEPLEATALHIVIATALDFVRAYEAGGMGDGHRDEFNARTDTDYWRENAANQALSDSLKAMMTAWFTQKDIAAANIETYQTPHYAPMSWHCLFAGYGTFPPEAKMRARPAELAPPPLAETEAILAASASNFAPL